MNGRSLNVYQKIWHDIINKDATNKVFLFSFLVQGCRDRMVVGFTPTYAISAYYYSSYEIESRSGEVYLIQHYVIKIVSDLRQVRCFLSVPSFLHQ